MADPLDHLSASDRRLVGRLADDWKLPVEALIPALVAGYLRLLRDAPDALPRNPLAPLHAAAERAAT
ncbi:MAG: hypothetical protein ACU0E9_07875 [Limimaricola soesokkakensis]|uniref:hypothetical protein n=1 Tax=Limimaricola soesokkakensis TaxID=1343159 RepID=UPI0040592F3B